MGALRVIGFQVWVEGRDHNVMTLFRKAAHPPRHEGSPWLQRCRAVMAEYQVQLEGSLQPTTDDFYQRKFNSDTWVSSGAVELLKTEHSAWQRSKSKKTFYNHMFKRYALGIAPSETKCNGRGHCSVSKSFPPSVCLC